LIFKIGPTEFLVKSPGKFRKLDAHSVITVVSRTESRLYTKIREDTA